MWWPAVDEDITVQSLSSRLGKSLLLEVKTTDWNWRRCEHRLTLDVDQLRRYQHSPVPVYYVFPIPPWHDVLTDGHTWLKSRARGELIEAGHGWFGDWMFVTRAQTLWAWLGHRRSQKSATLFASSGGAQNPSMVWPMLRPWWTWTDFWNGMARCGSREMPAMFTSPTGAESDRTVAGSVLTRRSLMQRLASSRGELDREESDSTVERFTPTGDDGYSPLAERDLLESPLTSGATGRSTALVHLHVSDLTL